MYYEVNVTRMRDGDEIKKYSQQRYEHWFATAARSIQDKQKASQVYQDMIKRFPEPKFKITVSFYEETGRIVDLEQLLYETLPR